MKKQTNRSWCHQRISVGSTSDSFHCTAWLVLSRKFYSKETLMHCSGLQCIALRCSASVLQCATVHFSDWSFQTGATMCMATKSLGKKEGGDRYLWINYDANCQCLHSMWKEVKVKERETLVSMQSFKVMAKLEKLWIYGKLGSAKWKI